LKTKNRQSKDKDKKANLTSDDLFAPRADAGRIIGFIFPLRSIQGTLKFILRSTFVVGQTFLLLVKNVSAEICVEVSLMHIAQNSIKYKKILAFSKNGNVPGLSRTRYHNVYVRVCTIYDLDLLRVQLKTATFCCYRPSLNKLISRLSGVFVQVLHSPT